MSEFTDCPCALMAPCNKLGPAAEFLREVKGVTLVAWVAYFPATLDPYTVWFRLLLTGETETLPPFFAPFVPFAAFLPKTRLSAAVTSGRPVLLKMLLTVFL